MTDYNSTFTSTTGSTVDASEVDTQYDNIATAINSKINNLNYDLTGTATVDGNTLWHQGNETHSFATNGYQILPNGLIVQWGTGTAGGPGVSVVNNYPITFPTAAQIIVASHTSTDANEDKNVVSSEINLSSFNMSCEYATVIDAHWIAVGY